MVPCGADGIASRGRACFAPGSACLDIPDDWLFDGSGPEQDCQHKCPNNAPAYPCDVWMVRLPLQNALVKIHRDVSSWCVVATVSTPA